jgi:CRISPR/Cas system-associated exonuclease Cas4 (RecB family)
MYEENYPLPGVIRATELSRCPRQTILKRRIKEFTVNPDNLFWLLRGKAIHSTIEEQNKEFKHILAEKAFEVEINGFRLIGHIDEFDTKTRTLIDYKTTSDIRYAPFEDHKYQMNVYKYLMEKNGYRVERMILIYLDMKKAKKCFVTPIKDIEKDIKEKINHLIEFMEKPNKSRFEYGWQCGYCPKEIYLTCNAMIIKKVAKKKLTEEELITYLAENYRGD